MQSTSVKSLGVISSVLACVLLPALVSGPGRSAPEIEPESKISRNVASALRKGDVAEAVRIIGPAVAEYPRDAVLRRREAQVFLCRAFEIGGQYETIAQDLAFVAAVDSGIERLREGPRPLKLPHLTVAHRQAMDARRREHYEELLGASAHPTVLQYRRDVRELAARIPELSATRREALERALRAAETARRLGDTSTERELTAHWCRAEALLFLQEAEELVHLSVPGITDAHHRSVLDVRAFLAQHRLRRDGVLRGIAALGKERGEDPVALAGAADLLSALGHLLKIPDPLRTTTMATLNHRFLGRPPLSFAGTSPASRALAKEHFARIGKQEALDPVTEPADLALRYFREAYRLDKEEELPDLRIRLYLLTLAHDPGEAVRYLEDTERRHPRDAVVPLEKARKAFLVDLRGSEGVAYCREAARHTRFTRRYLVALPPVLRPALERRTRLRLLGEKNWPDYAYLFTTLRDIEQSAVDRAVVARLRDMRLRLAVLLCSAPEVPDRAQGIHHRTVELGAALELPDLPEAQRTALQGQLATHLAAFRDFPRTRKKIVLTVQGVRFWEYPRRTAQSDLDIDGPFMDLERPGAFSFVPPRIKRRSR